MDLMPSFRKTELTIPAPIQRRNEVMLCSVMSSVEYTSGFFLTVTIIIITVNLTSKYISSKLELGLSVG